MTDPVVTKLQEAVSGLLLPSESDEPWEVFQWDTEDPLTPKLVREYGKHDKHIKVVKLDYLDFMKGLTESKEWYGEEENAAVVKYAQVVAIFEDHLSEAAVFRVGGTKVTYYVIGKSTAADWIGIKAHAVET